MTSVCVCLHTCGCVSITHQLKWPPWCSRRLTVLMATTTRNIFFCDIALGFTGTVGGEKERREKSEARRGENIGEGRVGKRQNEGRCNEKAKKTRMSRGKENAGENGRLGIGGTRGEKGEWKKKMKGSRDKERKKGIERANKRKRRTW